MMARRTKQEQREAVERLRAWLAPGDTAYTILRHVSSSGMTRDIQVIAIDRDDQYGNFISYLGYNAATALGWTYNDQNEGVRVSGAGMDMGFHLVYSLAHAIFDARESLNLPEDPRLEAWRKSLGQNVPRSTGYALDHRWI